MSREYILNGTKKKDSARLAMEANDIMSKHPLVGKALIGVRDEIDDYMSLRCAIFAYLPKHAFIKDALYPKICKSITGMAHPFNQDTVDKK